MSFATDLFSGLTGFRDHLVGLAEEAAAPALAAVEGHLARLEPLVRTNILAAEEEGKAILHELYGSLVKGVETELGLTSTVVPVAPAAPVEAPAAAPVAEPVAAPVAADPTPAPSTTTEASSAPSSTPSASAADTAPAAPAAPAA